MDQVTTARVGYLIKRAQMVLHDAMADALGSHDLTVPQFAVITGLDEEPGLSNADLARRAFVTPQSMHARSRCSASSPTRRDRDLQARSRPASIHWARSPLKMGVAPPEGLVAGRFILVR